MICLLEYVFIDESGDLGAGGSKYLVLAALIVSEFDSLDRIIKNMRRNKFKKELSKAMEVKASHSLEKIVCFMLSKLNETPNARILYVVLEKKKLRSEFLKNNKHKLYNYVAGKLARNLNQTKDYDIKIDKSKGKQFLQQEFNNYFKKILSPTAKTIISHSYSHSWAGLQFADVLAWACFQKFEHNNASYMALVKLEQEILVLW